MFLFATETSRSMTLHALVIICSFVAVKILDLSFLLLKKAIFILHWCSFWPVFYTGVWSLSFCIFLFSFPGGDKFSFLIVIPLLFDVLVKKGEKGVDLLASLCNMYDASEADLRRTLEMTNKLIEDILKKKPCPASECKTETLEHIGTGLLQKSWMYFGQHAFICLCF